MRLSGAVGWLLEGEKAMNRSLGVIAVDTDEAVEFRLARSALLLKGSAQLGRHIGDDGVKVVDGALSGLIAEWANVSVVFVGVQDACPLLQKGRAPTTRCWAA